MGTIRVAQRPAFGVVAGIALVLALALIAFALLGQVSRKSRVPGLLMPVGGLLQVASPLAGQVQAVLVGEGDAVRRGQPLLRVHSERQVDGGDMTALTLRAIQARRDSLATERRLQARQSEERRQTIDDRLASLRAETSQAREELEMVRQRVELARRSRQRYVELASRGFVPETQAQQRDEELLDLQARERGAQRSIETLTREAKTLEAELVALPTTLATTMAQLDRGVAQLEQERAELEARTGVTVTAPRDGHVSALPLHAGQAVLAGQTLATLTPGAETLLPSAGPRLVAQLYAPSRTVGFIQPGQPVWLRYAAYPYQKFGMAKGEVAHVSATPIAPQDLPAGQGQALVSAAQANEPLYRIDVRLDRQDIAAYGRPVPLRAGMALDADVSLEHRRIWEWLLEPLLATTQRL
ncbi:HlyD family efflux transporter periplasmic adaptor subunit [Mitsuaria sp. GD03876]|uniref:HlyD family secretion protein n=1 Tax=Mitsuaria sp. GD03876 TaxID=2975399 RepID=UPI0024486EEA|nr:HlyD family efflux transporter periplasmic adaptor subunit [Mitsuaria sp. GD03876]MDH0863488.1 HlyD family efflux transporter periplasmic adaptor subunit [Mitsuaria sp. GD03876]